MFTYEANLSNILTDSGYIDVSEIVHKAFIEINEKGTEAAAATCNIPYFILYLSVFVLFRNFIHLAFGSRTISSDPIFFANHPFLFYILRGDDIIFIGRKIRC